MYTFVLGPVAVTVTACEVLFRGDLEGGVRVEVRRTEQLPGRREGNEGFQVLPVHEGGIWRSDLLRVIDPPTDEPRYHHHPRFTNGDVGERVFDPDMAADPPGWTVAQLERLPDLLVECGAADLAGTVDTAGLARALPAIRAAIDSCAAEP